MVAFYKHNITDWRGGTADLSDRAYRVYHVIVEQIMLCEGPIPVHERTLAGLSNRSVRDLQAALTELLDAHKIRIEDGRIHNVRAEKELVSVQTNRQNAGKGGRAHRRSQDQLADFSSLETGREVGENIATTPREVGERSATIPRLLRETAEKPNENNDLFGALLQHDGSLKEKTRVEERREEPSVISLAEPVPDAAPSAPAPKPKTEKRLSRISDGLVLDDRWREVAEKIGVQARMIEVEFDKFCDHHRARGSKMLDWLCAWRTWCRNSLRFNQGRSTPTPKGDDGLHWRRL